ncbi:MAG: hypothetical protein JWM98_1417, partial [Thermoleophilia bacterium]|nr:hypothetical protein [Thermoleophilia bacterium]
EATIAADLVREARRIADRAARGAVRS